MRKDYAGAERELREALRCDPTCARAHVNLARMRTVREDYGGAARGYREAIRCAPDNAEWMALASEGLEAVSKLAAAESRARAPEPSAAKKKNNKKDNTKTG
jgi:lipopolysaccharide biosynthesis regulator YciM